MTLSKQDYELFADQVVRGYIDTKTPLNESILKIADEQEFNPDQIKRLVEASNVKTFLELFNKPENKGQNVEFDVANPEEILKRYYNNGEPVKKVTVTKVTVTHDTPSDGFDLDLDDMMRPCRHGASEPSSIPEILEDSLSPKRGVVVMRLRKVAEDLLNRVYDEEHGYVENLEKVAREFRKLYGPDYEEFEKTALQRYGDDVTSILDDIRELIGWHQPYSLEKCAEAAVFEDTLELQLLDRMLQHKTAQMKYADGVRLARSYARKISGSEG